MPCSHTLLLCNEHSGQVSPGSSAQLGVCFQQFCGHIPLSCAAVPHTCTGEQPGRAEGAALRYALGQTLSASLCACFSRKSLGIMNTVLGNGLSRAELAAELRVLTKHISAETAHKINRTMLFFTPFPFFPFSAHKQHGLCCWIFTFPVLLHSCAVLGSCVLLSSQGTVLDSQISLG